MTTMNSISKYLKKFYYHDLPEYRKKISEVVHPSFKVDMRADPEGDSSSLCSACTLPIFSSAYRTYSDGAGKELFLHDQCDHLPNQLLHELHPRHTLLLLNQLSAPPTTVATTCSNCSRICGIVFYQCPDSSCNFRLDLVCATQIKISHRSHHHSMMVIRQREIAASVTCSACDTKHDGSSSATLSYLCNFCGYWIHQDCASLLNDIVHHKEHQHSLLLTYNVPAAAQDSKCRICTAVPNRSSGVYICLRCPNYLVHIRCVLSNPNSFKPVFFRDAKGGDLCRLPLADENTSVVPYIREGSSDKTDNQQRLHPHQHPPLIFHENIDGDYRVCNACAQIISPPFFSCPQCVDFFLHSSCLNLPIKIRKYRVHEHSQFVLLPKAPKSDISAAFTCKGCGLRCNGFAYSCKCCDDFSMDVVCALMNPAITHESHKMTHILTRCDGIQFGSDQTCNGCNSGLIGICYECSSCTNFKLHVRCALLPSTVHHSFDKHPLQLITTGSEDEVWCEVCEQHLDTKRWYYGCPECDQSIHVDCIPSVDSLCRMKLGSTINVDAHGCVVSLTRLDDGAVSYGRRCGVCGEMLKNGVAYECSNCFYGIHHHCAEKCLSKSC